MMAAHILGLARATELAGAVCSDPPPGWELVKWNIPETAQGYGIFASLMAGFAISGLFWVARHGSGGPLRPGVRVLWAAIVPLGIAPLLYGEIAGELNCSRVAVVTPLPSLLLSIGVLGLFRALAELLIGGAGSDEQRPSGNASFGTESDEAESGRDRRFAFGSVLVVAGLATVGVLTGNLSLLRAFSTNDAMAYVWWLGEVAILALTVPLAIWARDRWRVSLPHSILLVTMLAYVLAYVLVFAAVVPNWVAVTLTWVRLGAWWFIAMQVIADVEVGDWPPLASKLFVWIDGLKDRTGKTWL